MSDFNGPGLSTLLTIALVSLKLTGVITLSWWWVLAPIWVPGAIVLGIVAIFLGLIVAGSILDRF